MLFLIEGSDEELSAPSTDHRLGCHDVEQFIHSKDLNSEAIKGENLEMNKLQIDKLQIDKWQIPELKLESESESEVTLSSKHSGQVSTLEQTAQLQGSSSNATQTKTEGEPLPLFKLCISPTPKIVNILSQLKKRKIKGPS